MDILKTRVRLRSIFFFVLLGGFIFTHRAHAQISPGELSNAHAQLEGIEHCTNCHTVGKTPSNDNCLACHKEIDLRRKQHTGYHSTIGTKECAECHKEHHGRNFRIVRFDTAAFSHAVVGFPLEGKHRSLICAQCHTKKKIRAKDVLLLNDKRKASTLLGLSSACKSCHEDKHKGQFTQECSFCHTAEKWKPASKFSHDRTKYPLTGKHASVQCARCHTAKLDDGVTVKYIRLDFASCKSCHTDPHKGKFPQQCTSCHTTDSFKKVTKAQFEHASTQFPLKGKHAEVKCEQCHSNNPKQKNVSGETGFHITRFRLCTDCHADAHAGQMNHRRDGGRCESCHNEEGFKIVQYSLSDHQTSRFPLTGAHDAIPCILCHYADKIKAKSTRQFRWEGSLECITCHEDIHKGQFASKMTKGCETCHATSSWQSLSFSHAQTKFPLKGKHETTVCAKCHKPDEAAAGVIHYAGLTTECAGCHEDEHQSQFAENGKTDCSRCHTPLGWKRLVLDHNKDTRFALTGKHSTVVCDKCHLKVSMNNRLTTKYKPLGLACTDCHLTEQ